MSTGALAVTHSCDCRNVRVSAGSALSSQERIVDGVGFVGPLALPRGAVTTVLSGLVRVRTLADGLLAHDCVNCGTVVYLESADGSGALWLNARTAAASLPGDVARVSRCFGVRVVPPMGGVAAGAFGEAAARAPEAHQQLSDMLAAYRARVEDSNAAKLKAFREELQAEARRSLDEARREADALWTAVLEQQQQQQQQQQLQRSGEGDQMVPEPVRRDRRPTQPTAATAPNKQAAAVGDGARPAQSTKAKSPTALAAPLWLMDEDQDDVPDSPLKDWSTPATDRNNESEDDNLNTSTGGLMPSSRRLLFGVSRDSPTTPAPAVAPKTMASSVPVSIPMNARWRTMSGGNGATSPGIATDDEAGAAGNNFERPDLIAPNTWQDQVREEWVSRSLRAADKKRTDDDDDLAFILAASDRPSRHDKGGL